MKTDQLVLDSAFDHVKAEQAAIVEKVQKIEPARKVVLWLAVAATIFVIGYYVDGLHQSIQVVSGFTIALNSG